MWPTCFTLRHLDRHGNSEGESERRFLDIGEAVTKSDKVALLGEMRACLLGRIIGGTVDIGMASRGKSGVGYKAA